MKTYKFKTEIWKTRKEEENEDGAINGNIYG